MPTKNKDINSVVNNNMASLVASRPNMQASPNKARTEYTEVDRDSLIPPPRAAAMPLYPIPPDSEDDSEEFDFKKFAAPDQKMPAKTAPPTKKAPPPYSSNSSMPMAPGGGADDYDDPLQKKPAASSPPRKMTPEDKVQEKIRQENAMRDNSNSSSNNKQNHQDHHDKSESFLTRPDRMVEKKSIRNVTANTGTATPGVQFYSAPTTTTTPAVVEDGPRAEVQAVQTARLETAGTSNHKRRDDAISYYMTYAAMGIGLLVAVVLIVVLVVVLGRKDDKSGGSSSEGTAAVTEEPVRTQTELFVLEWLPPETLKAVETANTPQAQAFAWMTGDSSLKERNYTREQLQQRFAMATFYYATDGQSWKEHEFWLSHDHHECLWYSFFEEYEDADLPCGQAVAANTQHYALKHLSLPENNVAGELPLEISWLTNLLSISLTGNEIKGTIPSELGLLTELTEIDFTENALTGEIPSTLGELSNLSQLYLEFNELTGIIPPELADAPLDFLRINRNGLIGSVPQDLCTHARVSSDCTPTFCGCSCENC